MSQRRPRTKTKIGPTGRVRSRVGTPTTRTNTFASGNSQVQVNDSTINVIGGSSHTQIFHAGMSVDLQSVLRAIPNFRRIHQYTLGKATPGTGMWLLRSPYFRIWLEPNGDIKILWGSGICGAGKSILASLVIDFLETQAQKSNGKICVAYIYIRYSDSASLTVRGALEVFVKQLTERHPVFLPDIQDLYAQHLREDTQPTEAQLMGLLQRFTEHATMFFVLDALDEALPGMRLDLVRKLATLNCKIFITSRPLGAVEDEFPGALGFSVVAQQEDLDLHIKQTIERSEGLQRLLNKSDASIQEVILDSIKQKCGGMFLHASLQLESISQCLSVQEIEEALDSFPSGLEEAYLRTWNRIVSRHPKHERFVKYVFLWILNARRSMTIDELLWVAATSPETHQFNANSMIPEASLVSLCGGLVSVEEESRLVRLLHYTAKDSLQNIVLESFPHPHSVLASVCITHFTRYDFQNATFNSRKDLDKTLQDDPLLRYAYEAWAFHSRQGPTASSLTTQLPAFIANCHAFPILYGTTFDLLQPLHLVAYCDLPITAAQFQDPNIRTANGGNTPLALACWRGHSDRVQELLNVPNTEVNAVNNHGWSALSYAAAHDHEQAVEALLAQPDIEVDLADHEGWSPLMYAASIGHTSIVELFIADGRANVNMVDSNNRSPLIHAASNGQERVVELLLAHPITEPNLVNRLGYSALMCAAHNGHKGTVQLLLSDPRIEVNTATSRGTTALLSAAEHGHTAIVQLLLDFPDVDINLINSDGMVVHIAVENGDEAMVRMLLDVPRINVATARGKDGRTAMSAALARGHDNIAQLLQGLEAKDTSKTITTESGDITGELVVHATKEGSDGSEDEDESLFVDALESF